MNPADNLVASAMSLLDLLGQLSAAEWEVQSLCPAWEVRDVVAHLNAGEQMLCGWHPQIVEPPGFDNLASRMAELRALPAQELLEDFAHTVEIRTAELGGLTSSEFDRPSWTPHGPATYGRLIEMRFFDFWVHELDIRLPLDRPGYIGGASGEGALDEVRRGFGYIVGKLAQIPDGNSVSVRLTGPIATEIGAVVDGRARLVAPMDEPDVILNTDFLTFMLLVCGRRDPDVLIQDGTIGMAGDEVLANRLARNLCFTR